MYVNSDERQSPRLSLRGQLYWILPVVVATMSVTVWLLVNPKWGGDVAAIIVIPINVASVLVPLLLTVSIQRSDKQSNPSRRRKLKLATLFTATILLITGGVYWFSREQDPLDYLTGRVKIGIMVEKYPGWNSPAQDSKSLGFDRELINYLAGEYHFDADIEELPTLDDRVTRLAKYSGSDQDIKLVIANFSITPEREKVIDFAGPYYRDTEGFFTYSPANRLENIPQGKVCVPKGAHANQRLGSLGWKPIEGSSLADCVRRFGDLKDPTFAVSTDSSVLAEYAHSNPDIGSPREFDIGPENYGIGIPNNRPRLCAELNKKIEQFISDRWTFEFQNNLPSVHNIENHQPRTPLPECRQPGD